MKLAVALAAALAVAACASTSGGRAALRNPSAWEGRTVTLCGDVRHGGLYDGGTEHAVDVTGVPEEFYRLENRGRKCLTGVIERTGYVPDDPDTICLDYCREWAINVSGHEIPQR